MHSYLVNGFIGLKLVLIIVLHSYLYYFYLACVLNDIAGVRIPCLCILYSNATIIIYAWTLGSFLILFRALFVQLVLWILWLLASSVEVSSSFILFAIFDPWYSLTSSKYLSFDLCIWFHSYYKNAYLGEELILYWPSKFVHPFWHLLPMGEKFRGFKGNGLFLRLVCS